MKRCSVKPYVGAENYIFVSYCHKDRRFVFPVIEYLNKAGYRVWFDEGIDPGSEWPEVIASHLNACAACVAFISENSVRSHNCRREINFALLKSKPFLSVFLEEVQLSLGMEMQLSAMQSILKFTYNDRNDFFAVIRNAQVLEACLGTPNPSIVVSDELEYSDEDSKLFTSEERENNSFSDKWFRGPVRETDDQPSAEETDNSSFVMSYCLTGKNNSVKVLIEKDEFTVGRSGCDFIIKDNFQISRKHATIYIRDGKCYVIDNNSTNKTYLNGNSLEPGVEVEVKEFDTLSFADAEFLLSTAQNENDAVIIEEPETTASISLLRVYTNEAIEINKSIFRIGKKQSSCDYTILDNVSVSRNHADIITKDGKYFIVDRCSTNKTFVNKAEIPPNEETLICDGDEVRLGSECFIVRIQ